MRLPGAEHHVSPVTSSHPQEDAKWKETAPWHWREPPKRAQDTEAEGQTRAKNIKTPEHTPPKNGGDNAPQRKRMPSKRPVQLPSHVPPPKEQLQREVEQSIPDAERMRQTHLQAERARGKASTRGTSVDSATAKADETLTAARKRLRDQLSASR